MSKISVEEEPENPCTYPNVDYIENATKFR